jgi:hypothetical protein
MSDLLEEVKEQEMRNEHVIYHDTHSVLLSLIICIVSIYLLYKLYTYMRRWTTTRFCKREVSATSAEVSHVVERGDRGSTVNINIKNSNDTLSVTDATPQSSKRALRPRVAKSYF